MGQRRTDKLNTLSDEELYHMLLTGLRKIEAQLLIERSISKTPIPHLKNALSKVRESIHLTQHIMDEKGLG